MSYFLILTQEVLYYFACLLPPPMKKLLFILLFLLSGNLLKSQQVDSLITIQNSPFLNDLLLKTFIASPVEIDNPYSNNPNYEMVSSLGVRILKMNKDSYLHFNGSGLLYKLMNKSDDSLYFKRLDVTNNFKYNINAFLFAHQGKIFNLGGYGFWRSTGTLRCYNEKNNEWDVVPTNEEIHIPIKTTLASYYPQQSMVYIPFQWIINDGVKEKADDVSKDTYVYSLDLSTYDWKKIGQTDPALVILLKESPWQISTENGLLFSHKNIVYHVKYLTNEVLTYSQNSSLSQTLERIYFDHYKYYANGTLYYADKKTGEYDSLKIPIQDFVKSDIKIWKNRYEFYWYLLIPIILYSTYWVIKKYQLKKNRESANTNTSDFTFRHFNQTNGQSSILPVVRFSEIEKQLLQLLLEKSKQNKTTTITEINYVLGIKDKNISLQKKVRSEVINSINEKFSFLFPTHNQLIGNARSQDDKRYFEYYIEEQNFTATNTILNEVI